MLQRPSSTPRKSVTVVKAAVKMGYLDPTLFANSIAAAKCKVPGLVDTYINSQDLGLECEGPWAKLRSLIYMIKILECVQPTNN